MARTPASSLAEFEVSLAGLPFAVPGTFSGMTGGERTAAVTRFHEGGQLENEEVRGGRPTRGDITVSRPWRRDRDFTIAVAADRVVGRARGSITKQPLDEDGNPYGKPVVYADALLVGVNPPAVDADSDDIARLEMVFAASGPLG